MNETFLYLFINIVTINLRMLIGVILIMCVNPNNYEVSDNIATKVKVNPWMLSTLKKKNPIEAWTPAPACRNSRGGQVMGQATDREWRHQGPLHLHTNKSTQAETKHQKMTRYGKSHREGERRVKKLYGGTNDVRRSSREDKRRRYMAEQPRHSGGNIDKQQRITGGAWMTYHARI